MTKSAIEHHPLRYAIGASLALAGVAWGAMSAFGQEFTPDGYVIDYTGLGSGGSARFALSERYASVVGDARLYLRTGANPAKSGYVEFYERHQPLHQHPGCYLQLGTAEPPYNDNSTIGVWPFPTMLTFDYWTEDGPTLIVTWQSAQPLQPNATYAILAYCPPRAWNPDAFGGQNVKLPKPEK